MNKILKIYKICVFVILFSILLAGCADKHVNLLIEKRCHELNEAYMYYNFPRKFHAHARPIKKEEIDKIIEQCYDNTKYASAGDFTLSKIISEQLNISYLIKRYRNCRVRSC